MKTSFNKDVKRFYSKALRQRIHLVAAGKSLKSTARMQAIIDRLAPYRTYAFTDRGAATFLLKKHDDLRQLIPPQSKSTLQQLDKLAAEARFILKFNCRIPC